MFDALYTSMQQRSKHPLLMVVRMPSSECEAPEHINDGPCWCDPNITVLGEGVYVIHHRRFEN